MKPSCSMQLHWHESWWIVSAVPIATIARRFYEALGGQLVLEEQSEEKGVLLDLVAYGWLDVSHLLPRK
ncbi:MAG: hypothetical protein NVSMB27_36920 [Ktedonobacteraceae bacterium]